MSDGLTIENTGSITFHSPSSKFHLKNILHCPQASAKLLSIQRFCCDNDCYFVLTSSSFFVKDNLIHAILLEGKSENGLYPIRLPRNSRKGLQALSTLFEIKTSSLGCHSRLGHPAVEVVSRF